jgi:dipeptidyl-peptidase-4
MNKFKVAFIVLILIVSLTAQDKTFTLKDIILKGRTEFTPKNLSQLSWMGQSNYYAYVDSLNGVYGIIKGGNDNKPDETILPIDSLNAAFKLIGEKPLSRFPRFDWTDSHTIHFWKTQNLYAYNIENKKLTLLNKIDEKGENSDIDDTNNSVAFTKENNLYIALQPDLIKQITFDTEDGIVNGQTVHRVEFGIRKGTFWSPKGNYLAYYHKDERMVYAYPLVDIDVKPAKLFTTRYPMTGEPSEHVQIAVYNLKTASTTILQTGEPKDQYLSSVVWSPDEKYIYVGQLNRDQNHLRMIQYDAYTGAPVKTLFEEMDPKYINPQRGIIFDEHHPDQFLWFSTRDGFNHLYLYNTEGKLIRQLTKGNFDVLSFDGFDQKGEYVFISAASPDGLDEYGYRVKIGSGKMQQITAIKGQHNVTPSADGTLFLDSYSSLEIPRKIQLVDSKGDGKKSLLVAENPFDGYQLGKVVLSKIRNDGVDLNIRLFYPTNFDPDKKYPVMVYVYGGPGIQLIQNRWMGGVRALDLYMSQEGYFVFTLDNRGSANRGREFEQATFRHLGTVEVADQKAGLDYLKSLAFIDTSRMGVFGWSYGGFMTLSMMTRLPGEFKAAVAGAPVTDWKFYEVMYGERYMDTPDANPEGYEESSTLNYIKDLQGNLLVIHGTVDPTVVWQNTLAYIDKAVKLGKQVDYAVYPGHQHGIVGKDSYHLYQKIYNYFDRFLKH